MSAKGHEGMKSKGSESIDFRLIALSALCALGSPHLTNLSSPAGKKG